MSDDEYDAEPRQKWTLEQLRGGNAVLSAQTGTNKFASQKGMIGIGQPRANVYRSTDQGYIAPDRSGEAFLRSQCGTNKFASQSGQTALGSARPNVGRVALKAEWKESHDRSGEALIPMQAGDRGCATQAGEVVIGGRRNTTPSMPPAHQSSQGVVTFQSGTNMFASQAGMTSPPGVGGFRGATREIEGLNLTEEQLRKGGTMTPWYAGNNKFASQRGSGGFLKVRDVVGRMEGGRKLDEKKQLACDGIVRLQSGTNKLASQRGTGGFGASRDAVPKTKWKQQWVDEYNEAYREWAANQSNHGSRVVSDAEEERKVKKSKEPEPSRSIAIDEVEEGDEDAEEDDEQAEAEDEKSADEADEEEEEDDESEEEE